MDFLGIIDSNDPIDASPMLQIDAISSPTIYENIDGITMLPFTDPMPSDTALSLAGQDSPPFVRAHHVNWPFKNS